MSSAAFLPVEKTLRLKYRARLVLALMGQHHYHLQPHVSVYCDLSPTKGLPVFIERTHTLLNDA